MLYCIGGIAPQVNLRVNNPNIGTLASALMTRMFMCEVAGRFVEPPLPSPAMVHSRLDDFKSQLCTFHSTPETYDHVVAEYAGPKRRVYERARLSLLLEPVKPRDAISVAFVKPEKVGPTKAPRCIQPRNPRYNLELGTRMKHIETRLYKKIAHIFGDGPTVMKGYNVRDIGKIINGKWNSFADPVAIGLDATKFDMHVSPAVLAWEHTIYTSIFAGDAHIKELLSWQMNNVGRGYCGDGSLKYRVRGKRFSGDMNTALGNCIIMCAMVWSYLRERGVSGKLVNNGDDCVVFIERRDLNRFQQGLTAWFLDLGFRMVCEDPVDCINQVEFCQMRPIRTVNGWTMVRNIPHSIAKDRLCLLPIRNGTELREWLGAVGECGGSITRGVPVMQSFYKSYVRNGTKRSKFGEALYRNSGTKMLAVGMHDQEEVITPEARYQCWLAWGILPDHQVEVEKYYDSLSIEYDQRVIDDYTLEQSPHLLSSLL